MSRAIAALPAARGPLSGRLLEALLDPPREVSILEAWSDSIEEEDLQLSLFCLYELHYTGFRGVDARWEWEPSLLEVRRRLEQQFESHLRAAIGPLELGPAEVVPTLWRLAAPGEGPSLSEWVAANGTLEQFREYVKHRSAYQLKEADPHTWAIPRLRGRAKAAIVRIQCEEYGEGDEQAMHSVLFARTMAVLGLDTTPLAYLDELPAVTLATSNLVSLLGLHRRLRGALVGHLALLEMTSTGPMSRYVAALERLGIADEAREFYEVHVEADEEHEQLAADGMVGGLLSDEPELAPDVVFGARALAMVETAMSEHILGQWKRGESSLRPCNEPAPATRRT